MIPGMGGRGMNPAKVKKMMKQMGIDVSTIENVEQVIIKTADKNIIFNDAEITIMRAQGSDTYQIVGTPEEIEKKLVISDEDIRLVIEQTAASEEVVRKALEDANGDLAEAILSLS